MDPHARKHTDIHTSRWHYVLLGFETNSGSLGGASLLRQTIQACIVSNLGLVMSNVHIDILWIAEDHTRAVIRLDKRDAVKVMASIAASDAVPRPSVLNESGFLPALLATSSRS